MVQGTPRGLAIVIAVGALALTAGCGDDDADPAAGERAEAPDPSSTGGAPDTTSEEEPMGSTDDRFPDGLRDVRYCEVLLLSQEDGRFGAEVWNTLGLNDCPQEQWDALDGAAIAEERGVLTALLNGPRYWTLDTIVSDIGQDMETTTFGEMEMFRAATVDLGTELPSQTPYTERGVARETVFRFKAGSEVHELTDPDGQRYVMQAYARIVDPTQTIDTLAGLGDRLELPEGWTFSTRTLDEDLDLVSLDGVATVVQDELQNTYQRDDREAAGA